MGKFKHCCLARHKPDMLSGSHSTYAGGQQHTVNPHVTRTLYHSEDLHTNHHYWLVALTTPHAGENLC